MALTATQLRTLAKKLLEREKSALYGEAQTEGQRLDAIQRMLVEETRRIMGRNSA